MTPRARVSGPTVRKEKEEHCRRMMIKITTTMSCYCEGFIFLFSHLSHSFERRRVFQQEIHHTHVVLFTSNVQRSESILLENNHNNETIIITAKPKTRVCVCVCLCVCVHVGVSVTDQCPRVGFGSFVQQHFGHAVVAAVCRHMQRGEVVQCDVINLCVVLQELFDAVHGAPLCGHVVE